MVEFDSSPGSLDYFENSPSTPVSYVWSFGARFNLNDVYTIGISEAITYPTISLFPNPSRNVIFLNGLEYPAYDLLIYDIAGQLVLSKHHQTTNSINISELSNGAYLLNVIQGQQHYQLKLIVQ
jgi:hypothetical protein